MNQRNVTFSPIFVYLFILLCVCLTWIQCKCLSRRLAEKGDFVTDFETDSKMSYLCFDSYSDLRVIYLEVVKKGVSKK